MSRSRKTRTRTGDLLRSSLSKTPRKSEKRQSSRQTSRSADAEKTGGEPDKLIGSRETITTLASQPILSLR